METSDACGFCGSSRFTELYPIRQTLFPDAAPNVVRCDGCELARTHPHPTAEQLAYVYGELYFFYKNQAPETLSARAKHFVKIMAIRHGVHSLYPYAFEPRAPKSELRVLDVGCGSGKFLKMLAEARPEWRRYGVELSAEAAQQARSTGAEVRTGFLTDAKWPDGMFDAVCFWDVFEHVDNPRETIAEAARILAPGGYVYFLIPNFDSVPSRVFRGDWWILLYPQHLYHYTPKTLERVCRSAGLKIEEVGFPQAMIDVGSDIGNWLATQEARAPGSPLADAVRRLAPAAKLLDRALLLPSHRMFVAASKA